MNKSLAIMAILVVIQMTMSFAQTATEALRLSESNPMGTARNLGTGNSMFAIGPDLSVIGSNPSGIAAFWKSEFTFTGAMEFNSFSSGFSTDQSAMTSGTFNNVSLPNIGFIVVNRPWNSSWKTSNWAIGLNRTADYRKELQFAGHTLGSMTDAWRENATGISSDDLNGFEEGLAWESGAIYDFESDNIYESDYMQSPQYALLKRESNFMEGGKTEIFLGYGANLDDKLLFGASVNIPFVQSSVNRVYREMDEMDGVPFFNELQYNSSINTTGYGLNGKLGVTVKPTKKIHIAAAVHSPTRFFLTDNFNTTLTYNYTDQNHNGPIKAESPFGSFQYALRTPWSLEGGLGIIAGTSGFIGASVKMTDYSTMKYDYSVRGNGNAYQQIERQVNADIQNTYDAALNLHIGGELAIKAFRVRGGVSMAQSPYANDHGFDPSYHAGFGFRGNAYFVDLGYQITMQEEGYLPYETIQAPQPLVISDYTRHMLALTLGLKF